MDIEYLKRFVLVGRTLNFRQASEQLFISQPTLSHSISAIEKELGVALLERNTKSVKLTHAGEEFYQACQTILSTYNDAISSISRCADETNNTLHIGYVGPAFGSNLSPYIKAFRSQYPEINLRVTRFQGIEIRNAIDTQLIQLAIIFDDYLDTIPGLEYEIISREKFKLLVCTDNPLSKFDSLSLHDIANEPFLICKRDSSPMYYDRILGLFGKVGIVPNIAEEVRLISDIYRLVDMNLGVAIMSLAETSIYETFNIKLIDILDFGGENLHHNRLLSWKGELSPVTRKFKRIVDESTMI